MKKFLFSRSHKKHYSNAVVRMGKNNLGFSLVELIIVIAIMAILAAIAIPVLGVFIEKAKISNDESLINDVLYAVELGNKSGAFMEDTGLVFGTVKYPAAFVVLNEEGVQIITSKSTANEVADECVFETQTIYSVVGRKKIVSCDNQFFGAGCDGRTDTIYDVVEVKNFKYCTVHSKGTVSLTSSEVSYLSDFTTQSCSWTSSHQWNNTYVKVPANNYYTTSFGSLYTDAGSGKCTQAAYGGLEFDKDASGNILYNYNADSVVYRVLADVLGDGFHNNPKLKLTYDEWVSEHGTSYATFYTYATTIFSDVQKQTKMLIDACNNSTLLDMAHTLGKDLPSYLTEGNYSSSADLLDSYASFIAKYYPKEESFLPKWNNAALSQDDEYSFALGNGSKNDYIWATRMAFNSSFASYLSANQVENKYVEVVKNYGQDELGGALRVPSVVNYGAFAKSGDGSLKKMLADAGDADGAIFEKIKSLYQTYIDSGVCEENGRVYHTTCLTMAQTGGLAQNIGGSTTTDSSTADQKYFGYYKDYLDEMAGMYKEAQVLAGDKGIIIIVYVEDGMASCEISPTAADPRNK